MSDLFTDPGEPGTEAIGDNALWLRGFALAAAPALLAEIDRVAHQAPLRQMLTPGGRRMSAAMTACGHYGWVTDRRGYRYSAEDPATGHPWPAMPASFRALAQDAAKCAGYPDFAPDVCLINRYQAGARMGLHQDRDEEDFQWPIVSVSLGLPMTFLWGGLSRRQRPSRLPLEHGDVLVWGGVDRLRFHGVAPLKPGHHEIAGPCRYNLTFRRAMA